MTKIKRKLSKQRENTVGKGEIARYEQFLLFPQCFQKACFHGASKGVNVWEWVKPITSCVTFKFTNLGEKKRQRMFLKMVSECEPWVGARKTVFVLNSVDHEI